MILLGKMPRGGPTLVFLLPLGGRPWRRWELICFGPKRHYRKDGACAHVEAALGSMRPWHRSRTRLVPWGNEPPEGRAA